MLGMQTLPCTCTSTHCTQKRFVSGSSRPATGPRSRWAICSTRQQQKTKTDPVATHVDRQRGILLASQRLEELLAEATLRQAFFAVGSKVVCLHCPSRLGDRYQRLLLQLSHVPVHLTKLLHDPEAPRVAWSLGCSPCPGRVQKLNNTVPPP